MANGKILHYDGNDYYKCYTVKDFEFTEKIDGTTVTGSFLPFSYRYMRSGCVLEDFYIRGYKKYIDGSLSTSLTYYLYADSRGYLCGTDGLANQKNTIASTNLNKYVDENEIFKYKATKRYYNARTILGFKTLTSPYYKKVMGTPRYVHIWGSRPTTCPRSNFNSYGLDNADGSECFGKTTSLFVNPGKDYDIYVRFRITNPDDFFLSVYDYDIYGIEPEYDNIYAYAIEADKEPTSGWDSVITHAYYNDAHVLASYNGDIRINVLDIDDHYCRGMFWGDVIYLPPSSAEWPDRDWCIEIRI